jgi:hypothetical protein
MAGIFQSFFGSERNTRHHISVLEEQKRNAYSLQRTTKIKYERNVRFMFISSTINFVT